MILALVLAMQAAPSNTDWNCEDPVRQQEMNWCAHQDYLAADAELNAQWNLTAAALKQRDVETADMIDDGRPGYFPALLEAQRAWIAFRDAHCRSEGYYARGGSLEPLLVSTCKTKLTTERTQQLQFLIEQ